MNVGQRLVVAYFVLFYFIPFAGNAMFSENVVTIYTLAPLTPYVILLLAGVFGSFLFMSMGPRLRLLPAGWANSVGRAAERVGATYRRQRLLLAIISLALSVPYMASGYSSYRYSYVAISETGSWLQLLVILLNLVVTVDLFYCMFVRPPTRLRFLSQRRVENILLSLVLVITANGTGGMLIGLVSMGYSVWPSLFYRIVFTPKHQGVLVKTRHVVITATLAVAVFGVAWVSGETIKLSSAGLESDLVSASQVFLDVVKETPEFFANFSYYLISAFSSYYYSLLFTADAPRELLNAGSLSPLVHPLHSLAFRFDYLTGGMFDVARPEYGSLSRLNYVILSNEPEMSLRQGTSPGLIGSFNYVFVFPFNILFCAIYLCWIARLTNRLLWAHRHESLSAPGLVLLLLYMLVLFQSPFDFLILLDNAVIYLVLLVGIALATPQASPMPRPAPARLLRTSTRLRLHGSKGVPG